MKYSFVCCHNRESCHDGGIWKKTIWKGLEGTDRWACIKSRQSQKKNRTSGFHRTQSKSMQKSRLSKTRQIQKMADDWIWKKCVWARVFFKDEICINWYGVKNTGGTIVNVTMPLTLTWLSIVMCFEATGPWYIFTGVQCSALGKSS